MVMSLSIHVADKMSIILDDDNSAAAHGRRHGSRSPPSHLSVHNWATAMQERKRRRTLGECHTLRSKRNDYPVRRSDG